MILFYINSEIDMMYKTFSNICLFCDFNARVKNCKDYTEPDYDIYSELNMAELYYDHVAELLHFGNTNVLLNRNISDKGTNNNGTKFLDFCRKTICLFSMVGQKVI